MSLGSITTRREFLHKGLTLVGFGATVPSFVSRLAWAIGKPEDVSLTAARPGVPDDRVLVIVQLAGGNDGLNTLIPFDDDVYHRSRPRLAVPSKTVVRLTDRVGLHPAAVDLKILHDEGLLSIVQGVGYPNPNRSHFRSTDIWESASPDGRVRQGWIGRYFDHACSGAAPGPPEKGIALTPELPLTLCGDRFRGVAFTDPRTLIWDDRRDRRLAEAHEALDRPPAPKEKEAGGPPAPGPSLESPERAFLERVSMDARLSADEIGRAARAASGVEYPRSSFAQVLRTVARLIASPLRTRVYYVSLTGFDTHSDQKARHDRLLRELAAAMRAFLGDLRKEGCLDRVAVMTFSEFGRRVAENSAGGTDHGEAAPLFLFGSKIKPGLHGSPPDLGKLNRGDVPFTIDFRRVYAAVLSQWLRADASAVLGSGFPPLQLF